MDDRTNNRQRLELLREGDPALDQGPLSDLERAQMRQRILAEARTPVAAPQRIGFRLALPVGVAGVLFAVWVTVWSTVSVAPPTATNDGAGLPPTAAGSDPNRRPENRQLQFTTPGGTRIVWNLRRDFRMPAAGERPSPVPQPRS